MLFWIFAGMVVFYTAAMSPSLFLIGRLGVMGYMGARDEEPTKARIHARATRAVDNFRENFPTFLALAILAFVIPVTDMSMATTGAAIFVISRAVFHIVYMMGIPVLRSVVWTIGAIGQLMMAFALV